MGTEWTERKQMRWYNLGLNDGRGSRTKEWAGAYKEASKVRLMQIKSQTGEQRQRWWVRYIGGRESKINRGLNLKMQERRLNWERKRVKDVKESASNPFCPKRHTVSPEKACQIVAHLFSLLPGGRLHNILTLITFQMMHSQCHNLLLCLSWKTGNATI